MKFDAANYQIPDGARIVAHGDLSGYYLRTLSAAATPSTVAVTTPTLEEWDIHAGEGLALTSAPKSVRPLGWCIRDLEGRDYALVQLDDQPPTLCRIIKARLP